MDITSTYHYPPEFLNLLVDTIPKLNRSKNDVFVFFKGAGVAEGCMANPYSQFCRDPKNIDKYAITRQILTSLNERGDACLRERREIVKRVVEFESFDMCWDNDRQAAKGLVAEIRRVLNVKDSFTRMSQERENERKRHIKEAEDAARAAQKKKIDNERVKSQLFALFAEKDAQSRGKALEGILNELFRINDILIKESFHITGDENEGIVEQIDGVIELDGHVHFVEMKWWESALGVPQISQHLVRVYHRAEARAIIISASGYSDPAISECKTALSNKVIILCCLQEIVSLLEQNGNLKEFIRTKIRAAITDKNPYLRII